MTEPVITTSKPDHRLRPVRMMVVDDSVVVRRVIARSFEDDPFVELAGIARDGAEALEKLDRLQPDVVVLDLEMPVMDGRATLAEIRRRDADLPVIVFSNKTTSSAAHTFDALAGGATDFVIKPSAGDLDLAIEDVRAKLGPLVRALRSHRRDRTARKTEGAAAHFAALESPEMWSVDAIVVGVSTGGPNALSTLLAQLPATFKLPIVVVQHMPAVFTEMLAKRLDHQNAPVVVEARHDEPLVGGRVYIAPGELHTKLIQRGVTARVAIADTPPVGSHKPSVDVLFRSAAAVYGDRLLGVVMTGMGSDGLVGAREIRARGGKVLAQSVETCVASGMPSSVIEAGVANAILPLDAIGPTLCRVAERSAARKSPARAARERVETSGAA